jgi:ABC-type lipoprotein release transport system permease subunit
MNLFIAVRYLLAHMRQTVVCIAGVAISVMMFVTMQAMMSGFTDKFIIETVESTGHVTIHDAPRERRTQILRKVEPHGDALLLLEGE